MYIHLNEWKEIINSKLNYSCETKTLETICVEKKKENKKKFWLI